ncbi:formyltetrahydrofolate deformylase [Rubricoccus marinus]|uniref:Formyltetrahydrofolate deformylase n=1 Tax=Rubricoccus marinus TaxID=716817 RepID=A0A259U0B8_9BACT|nr:formyltetrahydrofolate deformylase [Rubricoccus marinus]OZC03376.1 formyltetrahydrofolate deformylase [Rubricoccus marinus]
MSVPLARLLITCPDAPGIVAAVSGFLRNHGANITALDQHSTDPEGGRFFLRAEFTTPHLDLGAGALEAAFARVVAEPFEMEWRILYASRRQRLALMVSKVDHALLEILWLWRRGELDAEIPLVVSNHDALREEVERFGVAFHHIPVTRETKPEAEAQTLALYEDAGIDLVVLARYMQILSPAFVGRYPQRILNIHHSFLPAFIGADPYRQAFERGVKVIGATAHYVTDDLDEGPILEQGVARVTHRQSVADLKRLGQTLERDVLARALRWHLEGRVLVHGNKTVVFA